MFGGGWRRASLVAAVVAAADGAERTDEYEADDDREGANCDLPRPSEASPPGRKSGHRGTITRLPNRFLESAS